MRRLTFMAALLCGAAMLGGCAPSATEPELKAMCENLAALRGEVDSRTLEERTAKVEEEFGKREALAQEQQEAALKGADGMLEADLQEAGDDEETKKAARAEHAATRKRLEQEGADEAAALKSDKEAALAEAKTAFEQAQKDLAEALDTCMAEARNEGVTQPVAQCRIKAESTDAYWNQCR